MSTSIAVPQPLATTPWPIRPSWAIGNDSILFDMPCSDIGNMNVDMSGSPGIGDSHIIVDTSSSPSIGGDHIGDMSHSNGDGKIWDGCACGCSNLCGP